MAPLVRPLMDNLECIMRAQGDRPGDAMANIEEYMLQGILRIESFTDTHRQACVTAMA